MQTDIPDLDHSFLPILDEAFRAHRDQVCAVFEDKSP